MKNNIKLVIYFDKFDLFVIAKKETITRMRSSVKQQLKSRLDFISILLFCVCLFNNIKITKLVDAVVVILNDYNKT